MKPSQALLFDSESDALERAAECSRSTVRRMLKVKDELGRAFLEATDGLSHSREVKTGCTFDSRALGLFASQTRQPEVLRVASRADWCDRRVRLQV